MKKAKILITITLLSFVIACNISPKLVITTSKAEMAKMGITDTVQEWEDGFRTDRSKGFFEWWYFDAHLDDGSTVVIVYMTKSIMEYKGPLKPGVMITITKPNGEKIDTTLSFSPDMFSAEKEKCNVKIGPNWVKGDLHTYNLHAQANEISVDLALTGIAPPCRPRDGKVFFDDRDHYFGWVAPIPHGSVKGTLTYDGETIQVNGTGYHDHNWGNLSLPSVQDHWYWGRAQFDDYTAIFVEQTTSKKYGAKKLPVFYLAKGDSLLTKNGLPLKLKASNFIKHSSGREYPTELYFSWEDEGNKVSISLNNPEMIEAKSLLSGLPTWKIKLIRIFANPYYFRFNSEMDLDIEFGDIKTQKKGHVLYELMQLK